MILRKQLFYMCPRHTIQMHLFQLQKNEECLCFSAMQQTKAHYSIQRCTVLHRVKLSVFLTFYFFFKHCDVL